MRQCRVVAVGGVRIDLDLVTSKYLTNMLDAIVVGAAAGVCACTVLVSALASVM